MRILVVNDDGIQAPGIRKLAELARQFGEVTVAAPKSQCSGMSHRITVDLGMEIAKVDFPVEGVEAYSIDGTPADCVKLAIGNVLKEKPDVVFSGINKGYNIGYEILYSGTVGAAMEALVHGVPAIAYSQDDTADYAVVEKYFGELTEILVQETQELSSVPAQVTAILDALSVPADQRPDLDDCRCFAVSDPVDDRDKGYLLLNQSVTRLYVVECFL